MRLEGIVNKGWGHEEIFVTNNLYCGKYLHFKEGSQFSMHFHAKKHESWRVIDGEFIVEWIDTKTAEKHEVRLYKDCIWVNEPLVPHRLICVQKGTILEISTPDSVEDNYRVFPGDSQK